MGHSTLQTSLVWFTKPILCVLVSTPRIAENKASSFVEDNECRLGFGLWSCDIVCAKYRLHAEHEIRGWVSCSGCYLGLPLQGFPCVSDWLYRQEWKRSIHFEASSQYMRGIVYTEGLLPKLIRRQTNGI
jgi:hypothetical protein